MCALCVDAEHEPLAGRGLGAGVETCHERAPELHLALARLLCIDPVGTKVEECLGTELLGELDGHRKRAPVGVGCDQTCIEEVLGPKAEENVTLLCAEPCPGAGGQR